MRLRLVRIQLDRALILLLGAIPIELEPRIALRQRLVTLGKVRIELDGVPRIGEPRSGGTRPNTAFEPQTSAFPATAGA